MATTGSVTKVQDNIDSPCADFQEDSGHYQCCGDLGICLGYGLCYDFTSSKGARGYYVAGCTDETYSASDACLGSCSKIQNYELRNVLIWSSL